MHRTRLPGRELLVGTAAVAALATGILLWSSGDPPPPGAGEGPGRLPREPSPAALPAPSPTVSERRQPVVPVPQISGVVRDRHGAAVAGAEVLLTFGVRRSWSEPLASLTTDAEGRFRCGAGPLRAVSPLQRRDLTVTVAAAARGFHPRSVRLSVEQTKQPIVLGLQRHDPEAAVLWGAVRDRSGHPVAGALICCALPEQEDLAVTGGLGGYAVELAQELAGGHARTLFAFHPDHGVSPPVQTLLPVRGPLRADFALTETDPQVDCIALDLDGRPLPGVRFLIRLEEEGLPPPGPRYRTRATLERSTGGDGRLLLRGFPPGRYRLRWSHAGEGGFFLDDVPGLERTVAREQMRAGVPIELRVPAVPVDFELADGDGRPLRDVRVMGTVVPPPGTAAEPVEYELAHPHRLWLPPGAHGTWHADAGRGARRGEFYARAGRVVVRVVLQQH